MTNTASFIENTVASNMKLAYKFAGRYASRGRDYDAVLSDAIFGLVEAASMFDPARGYSFSTLAGQQILGRIKRGFIGESKHAAKSLSILNEANEDGGFDPADYRDEWKDTDAYFGIDADKEMESVLGKEQFTIIALRYEKGMTYDEIARRTGLSKQWACQLEKKAIAALRKNEHLTNLLADSMSARHGWAK